MRPDVSVVISSYNYGRYIRDAIRSVKSHGDVYIEVVVVDCCSEDDSLKQIKAEGCDVLIELDKRVPNCVSRNVGIQVSSAPRICILDADDMLVPHALVRACVVLHNKIAFVCGKGYEVIGDGGYQKFCRAMCGGKLKDLAIPLRWENKPNHFKSIQMSTLMVWRTTFEKYGLFDESLTWWEDRELWSRWLKHGECGEFIDHHMSLKRIHSKQLHLEHKEYSLEKLEELRKQFEAAVQMRAKEINSSNTKMLLPIR